MKKVMLTLAGMLFIGVVAVQAQEQKVAPKDTTVQKSEGSYMLRDMTALKVSEVPAPVRTALQDPKYKGWDNASSKIYRNKTSEFFVVQIPDGSQIKTYKFDKNGKPIDE